jgi:hypothetical protein
MATRPTSRRPSARLLSAAAVLFTFAMAGCSADDVQLNGKLFDAVGINSMSSKSAEPKMAERSPLVMPPNPERVPEPGKPPESVASDVAALQDPDKVATLSRAEKERQQEEYCKVNYEQAKQRGDDTAADLAEGPLGPCKGSLLTAIKNWNKGEDAGSEE